MVCDRCGAERRPTGPCPNCGALPPGSPLSRQHGTRAPQGDGYGGRAARRGSGSGFGQGPGYGQGNGPGYGPGQGRGYTPPPPPRPGGRNQWRDDYQDYEEIDRGRALVPSPNDLAPVNVGSALPAIPGLPQTEEEERALGIRRPAYIPATDGHRKRRISSFRVVSGVLSLMLICMVTCTGGVLLGKTRLEAVLGASPIKANSTQVLYNFTQVPGTPAATPGPGAKYVTSATTARNVDNNFAPVDITSKFTVNNYVYVVVSVRGVPKGSTHTLSVRWFLNGVDVQLPPNALTRKDITQDSNAYFALEYPTPGLGMVKIYWDRAANGTSTAIPTNTTNATSTANATSSSTSSGGGDQALAQSLYFAVQPAVPTVTPSPNTTTTPNGTPSGTPSSGSVAQPVAARPSSPGA